MAHDATIAKGVKNSLLDDKAKLCGECAVASAMRSAKSG